MITILRCLQERRETEFVPGFGGALHPSVNEWEEKEKKEKALHPMSGVRWSRVKGRSESDQQRGWTERYPSRRDGTKRRGKVYIAGLEGIIE